MTRITLVNLEPIRLTQLQTPTAGRSSVAELNPGDILTAQVVRSIGSGRFLLNLQGNQLVAASNTPLTAGQQISLQVSANQDGQASVHLLTLADGVVAQTGGKPNSHGLERSATQTLPPRSPSNADPLGAAGSRAPGEISTRLDQLLRSDGPLRQLLAERPDLAPRIESLLSQIAQRPRGLGENLSSLQTEIGNLLSRLPAEFGSLTSVQSRLAAQLFPAELMDQPEQLAQSLASRFESLARGLEATLADRLPSSPATGRLDNVAAGPANSAASGEHASTRPEAGNAVESHAVIQRTFEGDLKGQLLELRSQLTQLSEQSAGSNANLQQAIVRTDALLEQVTAQQVRNLEGLNQFVYAEIPVDPKTGIQEARLQVFYRNRQRSGRSNAEVDRFTIAMFLNMSRLGDVMTVVSSIEGSLTVGFTVNGEAAEKLIGEQAQELRDALSAAGHPNATVTVRRSTSGAPGRAESWEEFLSLPVAPPISGSRLNAEA